MSEKRILLIIGGGIAAYKSLELIRELSRRGIKSRCIVTKGGQEFVTPLSVSALSGEKCFTELFDLDDEADMGHIELSRSAELVVVCPATADLMAKAANGLANDLASTTLLATDKPVLMVPAMNVRMWQHAATQRNLATLRADGVTVMDPDEGAMACGEFGPGRLPEPLAIADQVEAMLGSGAALFALPAQDGPLKGRHALITAGPTREPLDPVRFLSNHSSGKQGYAIAGALAAAGARVTLVSGPVSLSPPVGVDLVPVETARDMLKACEEALPADIFVSVAAVADWRPSRAAAKKMKLKEAGNEEHPTLELSENPDILATLSRKKKKRPSLIIGFAAETHDVEDLAIAKLKRKRCDWIVANDVSGDVMGGTMNQVSLVTTDGVSERWPRMDKAEVAARLGLKIAAHFEGDKNALAAQ
ncbi:bifunctional phosphopantothenoylcysteine decarboxylase/phosphopantothenate--cysteine ligase CoaBC [Hyphomonas sp. FCG-A18]|uniref:bifunctional phosphopantothenoylcysteine decarboxylase/phosphopantothenate--cysteine ligase CoaBC n=1 Tax=Hyphomonas sp. FCG-A18 TaxID=3080019 RepID=UPI002B2F7882|nr:bifunctional phosphopantothenoylcysteine decarboxylase/phosphopantothenate--cysteine ligase CoaBC [Hyphomonas sp. FCG-A18]